MRLHDKLLQEQGSLWSTIKNFFGFQIPFDELCAEVNACASAWETLQADVMSFEAEHSSLLGPDEGNFLEVLKEYVIAVRKAVIILKERQELLLDISKSAMSTRYTYNDFSVSNQQYEDAIRAYVSVGQCLTVAYRKVFE